MAWQTLPKAAPRLQLQRGSGRARRTNHALNGNQFISTLLYLGLPGARAQLRAVSRLLYSLSTEPAAFTAFLPMQTRGDSSQDQLLPVRNTFNVTI